jgi:hypothetical protein
VERLDRRDQLGPAGRQRIIMHHQRAEARHRFDHARDAGDGEPPVELLDRVDQRGVDDLAIFDDQGGVAGGQEFRCGHSEAAARAA